jgi:methionine-rich copper-binding protein CopC
MRWVLFGLIIALGAGEASAHAFLDHAVPPVGATVAASPSTLQLFFSEPIEPLFSGVTVATAGGQPVTTGAAAVDPNNPAALVLPLPQLKPGRYRVRWHVASVDTHRTEGSFEFSVGQ